MVGTVVERLGSVWGETRGMVGGVPEREIDTDYLVRVDARLRGQPYETLRVRWYGGTIGDCTISDVYLHSEGGRSGAVLFGGGPGGLWGAPDLSAIEQPPDAKRFEWVEWVPLAEAPVAPAVPELPAQ